MTQYTVDCEMVGVPRFELGTPCSQSKCATRLRYTPTRGLLGFFGSLSKRSKVREWNSLDISGEKSPPTYLNHEIPFIDPPEKVIPDQGAATCMTEGIKCYFS